MFRIDTPTAVAIEPPPAAPGTPGFFTDGNLGLGQLPTVVSADFMNILTDEIVNVVTAGGLTLSKTTRTQLLTAIETLIEARAGNYKVDTGVANAYAVAITPTPDGTADFPFAFRAVHGNTGASTVDFGFGAVPLDRDDGTAMQNGDIGANSIVMGEFDHALGKALVQGIVLSQLGALAKLNLGSGLYNDGNGNAAVAAGAGIVVRANQVVPPGNYQVDTSAGPVTLTTPPGLVKDQGYQFADYAGSWGANNFTLVGNGVNIGNSLFGNDGTLVSVISDQNFSLVHNGTILELQ